MTLDFSPHDTLTAFDAGAVQQALSAGRVSSDGRHIAFWDGARWQRVWRRREMLGGPLAAIILCDAMLEYRLQAVSAFGRWIARTIGTAIPSALPTEYQARRLAMLLAIVDMRAAQPKSNSHEIARRLIYPRLSVGRGAEWKASSERRRTLRLIREAEAIVAGGYRDLLAGRSG